MFGGLHSPSAPHTELLSPSLGTKPLLHAKVAMPPYSVSVTDSSTAKSTGAGGPQSTTRGSQRARLGLAAMLLSEGESAGLLLPLQEAPSVGGWKGSTPP